MQEAVEWVRRCPDPMPGVDSEIEIRPLFEAEDFGKEFTPELRAQEQRLRTKVPAQQSPSIGQNPFRYQPEPGANRVQVPSRPYEMETSEISLR